MTYNVEGTESYLDKTYAEITAAFESDTIVQVIFFSPEGGASGVISEWVVGQDERYYVTVDHDIQFVADTADGVLTHSSGD
jgi:hypothetical protein